VAGALAMPRHELEVYLKRLLFVAQKARRMYRFAAIVQEVDADVWEEAVAQMLDRWPGDFEPDTDHDAAREVLMGPEEFQQDTNHEAAREALSLLE
jgi:hypothetical protein